MGFCQEKLGGKYSMKNISVIIPMYHAEAFIRQCVRSVQDQSEQNWEMIIIDDGSTDLGPAICEEFRRKDDRIRLYRQENSGVSCARNKGIDLADGKYVFFLDSDDMIHPRLFEEMLRQAEGDDCGLVFCGYVLADSKSGTPVCNLFTNGEADAHLQWQTAEGREV